MAGFFKRRPENKPTLSPEAQLLHDSAQLSQKLVSLIEARVDWPTFREALQGARPDAQINLNELSKAIGRSRNFAMLGWVATVAPDDDRAKGLVGLAVATAEREKPVEGGSLQTLKAAYDAVPAGVKRVRSHLVWLAGQVACFQNNEAAYDWAHQKPEFGKMFSGSLIALAERADNPRLARKLMESGADIEEAIRYLRAGEWGQNAAKNEATLERLQTWHDDLSPRNENPPKKKYLKFNP